MALKWQLSRYLQNDTKSLRIRTNILVFLASKIYFLDPPTGPMYSPPSVSPSVRQSVSQSDKSSHTSCHYFFLIFCNKLACYKCRKVTKPDFPEKLSIIFYKQFFKKSVFGHLLENASLLLAEIAYLNSSQYYLQLFYWHHGRENSSSPIFWEKTVISYKKSVL